MKVSERIKLRNIVFADVHKKEMDKIELAKILKYREISSIEDDSGVIRVKFIKRKVDPRRTKMKIDAVKENPDIFTPEEIALILGDS